MATIRFAAGDLATAGMDESAIASTAQALGMDFEGKEAGEVVLDITPNRPDLLDIVGLSRAMSFFTRKAEPREGAYKAKAAGPGFDIMVSEAVRKVRPYVTAMVAKGVDLRGSRLKYLIGFTDKLCDTFGRRRRKFSMGLHDLSQLEGPFAYDAVADKGMVPLGSDTPMKFSEIMARHPKGAEYSDTIPGGGAGRGPMYPYMADSRKVMALVPIINSQLTRATERTTGLFIDVTGTSMGSVMQAASLVACSLIDAGADLYGCRTVYPGKKVVEGPDLSYREMRLRKSSVDKTLGVSLEHKSIISLCNRMGHPAARYGSYVLLHVPPYRLDVISEQDLVEDVAIAYGYENIAPYPAYGANVGIPDEAEERRSRMARLMVGLGYTEAMNSCLTNEAMNFDRVLARRAPSSSVTLAYSKTENVTMLRTTLLPGLLHDLGLSSKEAMPQRLFERGKAFSVERGKVRELEMLAFVSEHSRANISEMRSSIDAMMRLIGPGDYSVKEHSAPALIEGRSAALFAKNRRIGYFGEVAPQVLENFGIEEPTVACEMYLDDLDAAA